MIYSSYYLIVITKITENTEKYAFKCELCEKVSTSKRGQRSCRSKWILKLTEPNRQHIQNGGRQPEGIWGCLQNH